MTREDLRGVAIATLAVTTTIVVLSGVAALVAGAWWPLLASLRGAAVGVPVAASWLLLFAFLTNRPAWARDLAWIYHCDGLQPELSGWKRPLWRGSDDWPGDDTDTYWRRTIVLRIPARRYLVVAIPIRRKHT